jgi:hypothetical protein
MDELRGCSIYLPLHNSQSILILGSCFFFLRNLRITIDELRGCSIYLPLHKSQSILVLGFCFFFLLNLRFTKDELPGCSIYLPLHKSQSILVLGFCFLALDSSSLTSHLISFLHPDLRNFGNSKGQQRLPHISLTS